MNNNIETVIDTNLIIAEALENDEYETTYEEGEEVEAQTEAPTKQENFFYRTFGVHDPFNAAFLIIIFLIIISIAITILFTLLPLIILYKSNIAPVSIPANIA